MKITIFVIGARHVEKGQGDPKEYRRRGGLAIQGGIAKPLDPEVGA